MIALAILVDVVGLWFLISALANWEWYKGIVDFNLIERLFGETVVRWVCGLVGVVLVVLGVVWFFQDISERMR